MKNEKVIERVVYIKTDEEFEQARKEASERSDVVLQMLRKNLQPKIISESLGVPINYVKGLAKLLNIPIARGGKHADYNIWRRALEEGKQGYRTTIRINLSALNFDCREKEFLWKIENIDNENMTITIKLKEE